MGRQRLNWGLAVWLLGAGGCFSDPVSADDSGINESQGSTGAVVSTTSDGSTTDLESSSASSDEPSTSSSTGDVSVAEIRAVHASPSAGAVDVYLQGEDEPVFEGLEYGETSDRLEVPGGLVVFQFRQADASPGSPPAYTSPELLLEDGDRITVVAAGVLGSEDPDDRFRIVPVAEDWGAQLQGRARARVVHVGTDAPSFRIGGDLTQPAAIARFSTTAAAGFELETEGGERIELLEDAGSDPEQYTSFTVPPVAQGDEVLLIATGLLESLAREPDGFSMIAVGRDGSLGLIRQDPELFFLHGSRDAATLEVCLGDEDVAANFDYGEIRSTRLSPDAYQLNVFNYPAGCVGTPLSPAPNTTGSLEAGERYLMLVTGEVTPDPGEAAIQIATFDDVFPLGDETQARVRFVHGASYTQVFVGVLDGESIPFENTLTEPIGWSVESVEVQVPAGSYVLGIADASEEGSFPVRPLVTVPYTAVGGSRQWAIVSGDPSPDDEDDGFLQVMVVDTTTPQWGMTVADVDLPPS
jgi:hypothetical protein